MKTLRYNLIFIMMLISGMAPRSVCAQNDSDLGRFSLDYVVGCAPLTVNLTEKDNFGSIVRQYIYEEGAAITNDTFYTYNSPGTYDLVQIVQSEIPRTDTIRVTVLEPRIPSYELYSCPRNAARIEIIDEFYDFYRIYFQNGSGVSDSIQVAPSSLSEIITFTGAAGQNIRIQGFIDDGPPNCGVASFIYDPISSIATPQFSNLQVSEHCVGLVAVEMSTDLTSRVRHEVQYSTNGVDFTVLDTIIDATSYTTDNIPTNTAEICFRIAALDECADTRIFSNTNCITDLSLTVPAVTEANATFDGNRIRFDWEDITIQPLFYTVERSANGAGFSQIGDTDITAFTDTNIRNGNIIYDYSIISVDTCGNLSGPSVLIRPVYLSAIETSTNTYEFTWNNYLGWETGEINYLLEVLDTEGDILESFPIAENVFSRNISQDEDRNFRIKAVDPNNNRSVNSNIIT
ncbi:MAG: hypothetical protein WBA74_14915, partial [Cyclobacteriaceae bacterium]